MIPSEVARAVALLHEAERSLNQQLKQAKGEQAKVVGIRLGAVAAARAALETVE